MLADLVPPNCVEISKKPYLLSAPSKPNNNNESISSPEAKLASLKYFLGKANSFEAASS